MAIFTFANNVNTTLAGPVSPSSNTITLSSTANLPASIPAGEYLVITLNDVATRQNYEILYATAITGATLTVLRGQEGTSALSWLTGDFAYSPPTAGQQGNFGQTPANNAWSGTNAFSGTVTVPAAVLPTSPIQLEQIASSLTPNGSTQLPNGWILQWGGTGASSSSATTPVTFFEPFPTATLQVFLGAVVIINAADIATIEGTPTRFGFNYGCWSITNTRVGGLGSTYIAIGY